MPKRFKRAMRRFKRRFRKRGTKVVGSLNQLGVHRFNICAMNNVEQPNDGTSRTRFSVALNYPCRFTNASGSYGTMGQPTPLLATLMNTFDQYRVRKLAVTFYPNCLYTATNDAPTQSFTPSMVWTFNDSDDVGLIDLASVQSSGKKPFSTQSGKPVTRIMTRKRQSFNGWLNCQLHLGAQPVAAPNNYSSLIPANTFGSMKFYIESSTPSEMVGRVYACWVVEFNGVIAGATPVPDVDASGNEYGETPQ